MMNTLSSNPYNTIVLAILLVIIAALPRLYNLGGPGFYMDEETTAFASRSMAEGQAPQMPSGMPYHRALPHSWLNSVSANIFGHDSELSYRLPGALLGILTAPLLFLFARPYVGTAPAFLAALLLAVSEWHILTSRQARMYAPFLLFYLTCAFSVFEWARTDKFRYFLSAAIFFIISASFHNLGVFAALIPLVALFIKGYSKASSFSLIAFSVTSGISSYLYGRIFVAAPYRDWVTRHGIKTIEQASEQSLFAAFPTNLMLLLLGLTGLSIGIWLGRKAYFEDSENGSHFRRLSRYLLAAIFGSTAATGHLHAAFLSLILLLFLFPGSLADFLKSTYRPLVAIASLGVIAGFSAIANLGLKAGIKSLILFPYPNWITLIELAPGLTLLYISAMFYLALRKKQPEDRNLLLVTITGLFPLIVVGIFKSSAPARYLIEAYPFILISSTSILWVFTSRAVQSKPFPFKTAAIPMALAIALSGLLGGHGLLSAYLAGTVQHGDSLNEVALIFPFYPDHKSPGKYVRSHRKPGDIVIAEDILEQRWYAGDIDYWLRNYQSHRKFLYKGSDLLLHDIYVNSVAITPDVLTSLKNNTSQRIWLITSGETVGHRKNYLDNDQEQWLEQIEKTIAPAFIGSDHATRVYCLNCNTGA